MFSARSDTRRSQHNIALTALPEFHEDAFKCLSLDEYRKEMAGIYTTCVDRTALDEDPKGIDETISHIDPNVDIVERITPVYNFKAAE